MGKGDRRTKRGNLYAGSFGKTRAEGSCEEKSTSRQGQEKGLERRKPKPDVQHRSTKPAKRKQRGLCIYVGAAFCPIVR